MLHATFVPGKSSRYKAYQGYRDDMSPRVHEEDEITSTILGPLDFLSAAQVYQFWKTALSLIDADDRLPCKAPDRAKVFFWDSRRATQRGLRIEPDGRVDFFWDENGTVQRRILLIEVKWRANLSGEDQLHRQWSDYLTEDERQDAVHIFLGIETAAGREAQFKEDVWKDRLLLLTWAQVRVACSTLESADTALGRWASLAGHFLGKVGISRFLGFHVLEGCAATESTNVTPLFWQPFSPWDRLTFTQPVPQIKNTSLFWLIPESKK